MQPGDSASVLQGVARTGSEIILMNRIENPEDHEKASTLFQVPKLPYCAAPIGIT
jgi:hypothetical protein